MAPVPSPDGRYAVFSSLANNLVLGDTNSWTDVFIRDRFLGLTERVSVSTTGVQGNNLSSICSLTADGNLVAFATYASNFSAVDGNGAMDIYLRDRAGGTTTLVNVSLTGGVGNGQSSAPVIAPDGSYVVFQSDASNMVASDTNASRDIFLRDLTLGTTIRISRPSSGIGQSNSYSQDAAISANGRYVAFMSMASNLVDGDTNSERDVFVYDRQTGNLERVSTAAGGVQANNASFKPSISRDGRYVAFHSWASNLVPGDPSYTDCFVKDRWTGAITKISVATDGTPGNGTSQAATISLDGRFVTYQSDASNLVPGDTSITDVFLRDLMLETTSLASVSSAGVKGNGATYAAAITGDGCWVAFESAATNFIANDTNSSPDAFMRFLRPKLAGISGTVTLQDFTGDMALENVRLVLRNGEGNTVFENPYVSLDSNGIFSTSVPEEGIFTVVVRGRTWLSKAIANVEITSWGVSGLSFSLTNGDVDGDDEVGPGDFAELSSAFGSTEGDPNWIANADLDGDGEVGPSDFSALSTSFGISGD